MYTFDNYANMIRDRVRVLAYRRAIDAVVGPDSVVLDLGAGTGAFAMYAAQRGARKVYAVETNPLIELGRLQASELGLADRIEFFHGPSESFQPRERADVLVSDLRGVLPFLGSGRAAMEDAKARLLTPDAKLIPLRDHLYAAPVSNANWYSKYVELPWIDNELQLPMPLLRRYQASIPVAAPRLDWIGPFSGQQFGLLDYATSPQPLNSPELVWQVDAHTSIHALLLWFDSELREGIALSAAPGGDAPHVYGRMLLPLETAVDVQKGDSIHVALGIWPFAGDFTFTWRTCVKSSKGSVRYSFIQNSVRDLFARRDLRKAG